MTDTAPPQMPTVTVRSPLLLSGMSVDCLAASAFSRTCSTPLMVSGGSGGALRKLLTFTSKFAYSSFWNQFKVSTVFRVTAVHMFLFLLYVTMQGDQVTAVSSFWYQEVTHRNPSLFLDEAHSYNLVQQC